MIDNDEMVLVMKTNIFYEFVKHDRVILPLFNHGTRKISIAHEIAIRLIGIVTTIFGSILNPLVSSSKNLNRPALDAGSGAPFFLLLIVALQGQDFRIKTLLLTF
jgi:hypothetical protein